MDDIIESILFIARNVNVFKIPPRASNEGYRAADWVVEKPLWNGRLKVIERGEQCIIILEDPNTGELFAQAPYDKTGAAVEAVLDSSRYFVFRVEGEGGRKAYIGVGFEERTESFDFNVALQDYVKRAKAATDPTSTIVAAVHEPPPDFSLKEGQTMTIKIPGKDGRKTAGTSASTSGGIGGGFGLLPPPPASGGIRRQK
ncbi:adaptin ear-binding coat-associated protein 1 NECAP-1 [Dacryopinax primogenitus]|uniref:Adaptin ear-binding coat-associated protein 1 NECAP-1 n=1 Tax=Dacryopinax primogenitus (strain DJM 731) TaxID=1858805 RepID=M5GA62_DACPD|nr:adaptin ear-binding coat-associated protein 1 NECAP-1 [Dacryopinax primogenitus]EJU00768.1 adaptin ear-binding coat-associated protein 1 NECAP-1 [Dacryopinax primogenitus]